MSSDGPEFNPGMRPDEPLTPFDVTRSSEKAILLKLVIGFSILLVLAFIVIKVYQPGVRDRGDPPLITAENTPFKIVPEDPGGLQTPDQDKEVFDIMSGNEPRTDVTILPPPEDPIDIVSPADRQPIPAETVSPEDDQPVDRAVEQAPATPTPRTQITIPDTRPSTPVATASDWIVQVASLRSQADAEQAYADIEAKHAAALRSYQSEIVRIDLSEKGIYYRARIVGFASKADADSTCERLKDEGQSCYVTRR